MHNRKEEQTSALPSATGTRVPLSASAGSWIPRNEPDNLEDGTRARAVRRLTIYVSHPSVCLTDHLPHGDGLLAYEFISRLAKRGHIVHVATPTAAVLGPLSPNIVLHHYALRLPFRSLQIVENMARIWWIFRDVRGIRTDVIHQLNPVEAGLSFLVSGCGIPVILGPLVPRWGEAALQVPGTPINLARRVINACIAWADAVQERRAAALLLSTPAALSRLHEASYNRKRMHILPFGIDTKRFFPAAGEEHSAVAPTRLLFLANLLRDKGIYTLLAAFPRVKAAIPSCQLDIAGSGPELSGVRQAVAAMSCRSSITLLGAIARQDVPDVMRTCNVYCLPTYHEAFGMTVLEAMACGKPVVTTDTGGVRYLVDEQGGRRVPVGDADGLATALIEILGCPALQRTMGLHNRARAIAEYDWDVIIDQLERIYEQVVPEPARGTLSHPERMRRPPRSAS